MSEEETGRREFSSLCLGISSFGQGTFVHYSFLLCPFTVFSRPVTSHDLGPRSILWVFPWSVHVRDGDCRGVEKTDTGGMNY